MPERRSRTGERRGPYRRPRTGVYVVCGGKRTEPDYLNGLVRSRRNPDVAVTVVGKGCAPDKLVTQALSRVDVFDEVWCVFDKDEFDLDVAVRAAGTAGVRLAVSNPCFEVWLLLHHEERPSAFRAAGEVVRRLRKYVPAYDKAGLDFGDFVDGVDDAVERGRRLHDGAVVGPNPSSGVWVLVDTIVKEAER